MKHQGAITNLFTDVSNWKLKRSAQSQKIRVYFLRRKENWSTWKPEQGRKQQPTLLCFRDRKEKGSKLMTDWSHMQLNVWLHT